MVVPTLILLFSAALFFFYCQVTVQKILRRAFDRAYFRAIADKNRLAFPALREALQGAGVLVDYANVRLNLQCDYRALTYLLKNVANLRSGYSWEERFLMLYFRLVLVSLACRHWLRLGEKPAVLVLTSVLEYFANVVGARTSTLRFADLSISDYMLNR